MNRLHILDFMFGGDRVAAAERASRWSRAAAADPRLARDLVELAGMNALPAERLEDGVIAPDPICPYRAMQERGEQNLARKLLALMSVTSADFEHLVTENDDDISGLPRGPRLGR